MTGGANRLGNNAPDRAPARTLAQTDDVRVSLQELLRDQSVPWHAHSEVSDTFVCVLGSTRVELRGPSEMYVLRPGETFVIGAGREHQVTSAGGERCMYVNVQAGGTYDFLPSGS